MSDPNVLLGYIEEPKPKYTEDPLFYHRANDAVLAALPVDDPYPPLCRSLFAVTGNDSLHGSFRGVRVIHFAARFNHVTNELAPWLDKFEALLRRLYWIDAEILVNGGWSGPSIVLKYLVDRESANGYWEDPPELPRNWELKTYGLDTWKRLVYDVSEVIGESRASSQQTPDES